MLSNEDQMAILKQAMAEKRPEPLHELLAQAEQGNSQEMEVAETPQEYQDGLRNKPEGTSMSFPNSSGSFNTKGMDYNIDMKKYSPDGDLVRSYESVPPGIENIPMGDDVGTVIETPSEYQTGGPDQSFRDGVKHVESADGKLMRNPVSSATGFYGQLYSEIKNIPDMKGISRDKFQSDTTLQNTILNRRWEGDIPGIPGLDSSANDLTDEYKSQLKGKWNYTHDEVAALVNFMGRQGTRKYFASLRTGTTHKVPGVNKTPEEYLEEYRLGAGSSQTTYAPKHVLGKDEFTYKGRPTVTYKQDATGNWFINTKGGNGKYVPIVDPEGNRSDILNKYTVKSKSKK